MSSKVLYPPTPTTPTTPLGRGSIGVTSSIPHRGNLTSSSSTTGVHSHLAGAERPRRAAAIASQAATLASFSSSQRKSSLSSGSGSGSKSSGASSASSTTLPQTPHYQPDPTATREYTGSTRAPIPSPPVAHTRPMAALPRAKRARRGGLPTETTLATHGTNGSTVGGYAAIGNNAIAGSSLPSSVPNKNSIMMGIDAALHHHHHLHHQPVARTASNLYRNGMSSSKSSGVGSTVREMIAGKEQDVYVLDSTSPEPSAQSAYHYHGGVPDEGTSSNGKRKAAESPTTAAPSGSGMHGTANGAIDYAAPPPTTKRRRREPGHAAQAQQQVHDQRLYRPDPTRSLYAGNTDPSTVSRADGMAIPPGGAMTSYRGGYHAGNTYAALPPQQPIDDAEGHFIVREGDYVTDRYRIVSLLGQGTFGKVVKCKDSGSPRFVAIKIIRAVQKYTDAAQIEIRVLQTLRENDPWNENKCIHLLETFTYRNHVCIVSELLGQSVFDFLKDNDFYPFPPRHIWHFARQLLRSVAFLHRLGLVHTDLKPENILLVKGDYNMVPITNRANSKKRRVLRDTDIRLIDFGSATFNDEYHSQVVSTRHYRAPEIILQMGWSFECDAWSIGCILIEFYTGEALFQTHDNLEHLAMMEAVLGSMPDDFRRKAETYRPNYFRAGRLDFPSSTTNRHSRKFVKGMKSLGETIHSPSAYRRHDELFRDLLEQLLTFDPNQRIRIEAALKHPYFDLREHEIPP